MSINEALKVLVDRGVDEETLKQVVLALGDVSQDVVKLPYNVMVITGFDEAPLIELTKKFKDEEMAKLFYIDTCTAIHYGNSIEIPGDLHDVIKPWNVLAIVLSQDSVNEYLNYEVFCRKENLAGCHAVVDYWMENGHI